jgi:hypothetical protein
MPSGLLRDSPNRYFCTKFVRVRRPVKVFCQLMFCVAVTRRQLPAVVQLKSEARINLIGGPRDRLYPDLCKWLIGMPSVYPFH